MSVQDFHHFQFPIGGGAYEARRLVPPQNFGPGGTLWSVPPQNFADNCCLTQGLKYSFLPNNYNNQCFFTSIKFNYSKSAVRKRNLSVGLLLSVCLVLFNALPTTDTVILNPHSPTHYALVDVMMKTSHNDVILHCRIAVMR